MIPLFLFLVLSIAGSCMDKSDGTNYPPQPTRPTLRVPRYTDSLCEGSDYAKYDDCR
ncbi:hypothetical protein [Streptomyces sp. NPDC002587]